MATPKRPYREHYGVLLVLLAAVFVLASLDSGRLRPGELVLLGAVLVFAQRNGGVPQPMIVITGGLAAVVVIASAVAALVGSSEADDLIHAAGSVLLCLATIVTILTTLIRRAEAVNIHTLLGVLSAYLLIGFGFASLFSFVGILDGGFFAGHDAGASPLDYLYFSFITLTTTGFGDLVPAGDAGRVLAAVEAVTGQLYLVTVVAIAVTALAERRR